MNPEPVSVPFYDLEPRDGSHYLLENGKPIARFDELEKAEALRAHLVAELAEQLDQDSLNAERRETIAASFKTVPPQARSVCETNGTPPRFSRQCEGEVGDAAFQDLK